MVLALLPEPVAVIEWRSGLGDTDFLVVMGGGLAVLEWVEVRDFSLTDADLTNVLFSELDLLSLKE